MRGAFSTEAETVDPFDLEKVKSANRAYYAALSARDLAAMQHVWSRAASDVNIAPPACAVAHTGWNAIKKNYEVLWPTLGEMNVSMANPEIVIRGSVAWVYGIENVTRKVKNGHPTVIQNFGTGIFVNEAGHWLMVFHQASPISSA